MSAPRTRTLLPAALSLFLASVTGLLLLMAAVWRPRPAAPALTADAAREAYGRVEIAFEANRGQTDASVDFLARGAGYALFLTPAEAVFVLHRGEGDAPAGRARVLRMRLVGSDAGARAEGAHELAGRANYFVGSDPRAWRTDVPVFARVRYPEVYEGVDLVYYGNQRQLEYDFRVAPGADPAAVRLRFEGAERVERDASGDLLLHVGGGVVRQPKPFVYQEVADARRAVEGGYTVGPDGEVGFQLGAYDPALPLVIDPVLVYSTYLGGGGTEDGNDIRVDSSGAAYIAGQTSSTNFPTANALQATFGGATFEGGRDAFVTKLNPAGTAFVYSTYLGGSGDDRAHKIAVDAAGNAYVAGETTSSTNFPRANALQNTFGGGLSDAFVTKLNASGNALVFSTYLGGNVFDAAGGIALDSSNNVYLTGRTTSPNFPTANAIQATQAGQFADAFVTKLNANGDALVYSTYLGGSDGAEGGFENGSSIAVDSAGNAYVTGQTRSTNFPTANAVQSTFGGGFPDGDAFVTKINAAGTAFAFSTYLGGVENDVGFEIALDSAGAAHVSGVTRSTNFPTANAMRATLSGPSDAFVTKLNPAGTAFAYSTYFGGAGDDSANGVAVDAAGNTYLAIGTSSTDFPTVNPTQAMSGGGIDAAVSKLNPAGSALIYSTYLGGNGTDAGLSIALDAANSMYLVGRTTSANFPTAAPVQSMNGGGQDAFVAKLAEDPPATPTPTPTPQPSPAPATVQFGAATFNVTEGCVPATLTVTLTGAPAGAVAVDYVVSDGTAKQKTDYTYVAGTVLPQSNAAHEAPNVASGRLEFALGETEKEIVVLITEDGFAEGTEDLSVTLSNPRGAALGTPSAATLNINDNETADSSTNPADDPSTFVCQLYHDFLHRQPDAGGQAFWAAEITSCGADAGCIAEKRHNVAAAFFLSIEFQRAGYFVYRAYEAGLDRRPQYEEFMRDLNAVGLGVEVGLGDWEQRLAAQRAAFAEALVQTAAFKALYPEGMTGEAFADRLVLNVGTTLTAAERGAVVAAYGAGDTPGRAAALTAGLESGSVYNRLYNPGFVLIEYFGFLRRDPDDPPDSNLDGFDFWLQKMNDHTLPGEDARQEAAALARIKRAEMVKAFILSIEYRQRFGP